MEGSHVEFHNLTLGDWYAGFGSAVAESSQTAYLGFYGITAHTFYDHANYVSIVGGSYGPVNDDASQISDCYLCNYSPTHVLIDGVYFHDYVRATSGIHMECLHVYAASYLTVQNSRFFNCAIMDLFIDNYGSSPNMHDILVQNNFFDQPGSHGGSLSSGSYGLYLGQTGRTYSNVTVRNNTSLSTMYIEAMLGVSNVVVAGNLGEMPQYQCLGSSSGVSYSHNVWYSDNSTAAKCGSTDKPVRGGHAAIGFVNYAGFDLHVTPRSPALSSGETTQDAERDIDGDLRPRGYSSDAGADQRETAAIVLGRSLGEIRIGGTASSVAGFYGSGSTSHVRIAPGGPVVELHRYVRHGARLWVAYAGGRVVGVGTSSPFYTTVGGLGVGAVIPGGTVRICGTSYQRTVNGVRVIFAASSRSVVRSISMVVSRYAGPAIC